MHMSQVALLFEPTAVAWLFAKVHQGFALKFLHLKAWILRCFHAPDEFSLCHRPHRVLLHVVYPNDGFGVKAGVSAIHAAAEDGAWLQCICSSSEALPPPASVLAARAGGRAWASTDRESPLQC